MMEIMFDNSTLLIIIQKYIINRNEYDDNQYTPTSLKVIQIIQR